MARYGWSSLLTDCYIPLSRRNTSLLPRGIGFANVSFKAGIFRHASISGIEEDNMDTNLLMIGVAVMLGLIGVAASRDLLRRLRPQPRLVPIRFDERQRRPRDISGR
jgi:hypothetical protein